MAQSRKLKAEEGIWPPENAKKDEGFFPEDTEDMDIRRAKKSV